MASTCTERKKQKTVNDEQQDCSCSLENYCCLKLLFCKIRVKFNNKIMFVKWKTAVLRMVTNRREQSGEKEAQTED